MLIQTNALKTDIANQANHAQSADAMLRCKEAMLTLDYAVQITVTHFGNSESLTIARQQCARLAYDGPQQKGHDIACLA